MDQPNDSPLPTEPEVSPAAHAPRDPRNVRWYLPGWGERLRLMGWRNVLWIPPILVVALLAFEVATGGRFLALLAWWKVAVAAVALPISAGIRQAAAALRRRPDPFCIHCGYSLTGLDERRPCPECGEVVSHATCREYQRDPHWFIARFKQGGATPATIDAPFEVRRDAPLRGDGT